MKNRNLPSTDAKGSRSRRGATLVMVAILMTVLMMFAGFGIDFSRMYTYKSQLKVLADAAALSAVTDLKNGVSEDTAEARAVAFKAVNLVEGVAALFDTMDVEPGTWTVTVDSGYFTPTAWSAANAVRTTPRFTADWTIARVFGVSDRTLVDSSVAVVGSYVASGCLAPIAVPYSALLLAIGQSKTIPIDELSQLDIDKLASTPYSFPLEEDEDLDAPGNFALVNFQDGNGNKKSVAKQLYDAINGCVSSEPVRIGDEVSQEVDVVSGNGGWQGNKSGNAKPGEATWDDLCNGQLSGNTFSNCNRIIQVPIVNEWDGQPGTKGKFTIVYIGAFDLESITMPQGNKKGAILTGTFTVDRLGGGSGFTVFPGPVQGTALVK